MNHLINIIILAAGNSKRMDSTIPKVLHKIGNFPMLEHIILTSTIINPKRIVLVIDTESLEQIKKIIEKYNAHFELISQKDKLGTGYATNLALKKISSSDSNEITVILYGDTPLIYSKTINKMIDYLYNSDKSVIILAFESSDEQYGKIITDSQGNVIEIVERNDNSESKYNSETKSLVNSGIIVTYRKIIDDLIDDLDNNNKSQEYYLTGIISLANKKSLKVGFIKSDKSEAIGVNNREDIIKAEAFFQQHKRSNLIAKGVTLLSPENTFFSLDTTIAKDTVIHPYVTFGPGVKIEKEVTILSYCYLIDCTIYPSVFIGPFAHIKGNSIIGNNCKIGNFVEVNNSTVGKDINVKHLSYIGNCSIGDNTNIGAGTVVCNYNVKKQKNTTFIGENCFIGGNSSLISPLRIDNNSIIAAGSTITDNVPESNLSIARIKQINKPLSGE